MVDFAELVPTIPMSFIACAPFLYFTTQSTYIFMLLDSQAFVKRFHNVSFLILGKSDTMEQEVSKEEKKCIDYSF